MNMVYCCCYYYYMPRRLKGEKLEKYQKLLKGHVKSQVLQHKTKRKQKEHIDPRKKQ